ncbi:TPA: helix-turn-helix domain-containing protein [Salmonella enterica subsp. enterica serovar Mississippi]|nr:helix-turn-helix domain-containing protein [Salmonella enterica subsp. enterica serovar Mississippi]HED0173865.1 helix-turn-helix domain-containing protein [Salmonella enterica subsp. enterica serovar Mississippi]HED0195860.1 helix-turn-helix domain-containing protein [Salmonella enterica subsp. enterica serovar Mississippi]
MGGNDAFTEAIVNWVEQHRKQKLSVDDITRISGYSQRQLQRKFRAMTGLSLGRYIKLRRLTGAAVALRLTRYPIARISVEWGFYSHQTFHRAFLRHFGLSPGDYRHQERWHADKLLPRFSLREKEREL